MTNIFLYWMTLQIACGPWDNDGDNFDEASNDCDDSDPNVHPYALEICDGIDNNCDGLIDDSSASGARTWYADLDRDGYGDDGLTTIACEQPEGYAPNKWDCNESNEFVNPGAEGSVTASITTAMEKSMREQPQMPMLGIQTMTGMVLAIQTWSSMVAFPQPTTLPNLVIVTTTTASIPNTTRILSDQCR